MDESTQPLPGAVTLRESVLRYGDLKLYKAWFAAREQCRDLKASHASSSSGWVNSWRVISPGINASRYEERQIRIRNKFKQASRTARKKLTYSVYQRLKEEGDLIAWARCGQPHASFKQIPPDAWSSLTVKWDRNTASTKDGFTYFNIHVFLKLLANPCWDGGLPLLDACKLLDPHLATELTEPWAPDLPDGTIDQYWADGSRDWAAGQMWRIICRYRACSEILLYVLRPDNNEWHYIPENSHGLKKGDFERCDFAESRVRLDTWEEPVSCLLFRCNEQPDEKPIRENTKIENVNKKPMFSEANVTKAYSKRVKEWPDGERNPSQDEDVKWGREKFGAPRDFMRDLRRKFAPDCWHKRGPKRRSRVILADKFKPPNCQN